MTIEEFVDQRHELPEGGRWTELISGEPVHLDSPDHEHGTTVLNLSRDLGLFLHQDSSAADAYICFELGLIISRNPDTVRFPAACCFIGGDLFSETDKVATETVPVWVVEIASTKQRRRDIKRRVVEYQLMGVKLVWVIDPFEAVVHSFSDAGVSDSFTEQQTATADPVFPDFQVRVADLFAVPKWWKG